MFINQLKVGEKIIIDSVTITVLSIDHGRVRLGLESPRGIPIARGEIWEGYYAAFKAGDTKERKGPVCPESKSDSGPSLPLAEVPETMPSSDVGMQEALDDVAKVSKG